MEDLRIKIVKDKEAKLDEMIIRDLIYLLTQLIHLISQMQQK